MKTQQIVGCVVLSVVALGGLIWGGSHLRADSKAAPSYQAELEAATKESGRPATLSWEEQIAAALADRREYGRLAISRKADIAKLKADLAACQVRLTAALARADAAEAAAAASVKNKAAATDLEVAEAKTAAAKAKLAASEARQARDQAVADKAPLQKERDLLLAAASKGWDQAKMAGLAATIEAQAAAALALEGQTAALREKAAAEAAAAAAAKKAAAEMATLRAALVAAQNEGARQQAARIGLQQAADKAAQAEAARISAAQKEAADKAAQDEQDKPQKSRWDFIW